MRARYYSVAPSCISRVGNSARDTRVQSCTVISAGVAPEISEDAVPTIQAPQHWTTIQRRPSRYYPISLQLRYKAKFKLGPVYGFAQTKMMSSQDIIFAPGNRLAPGMNAEVVLDWPRLRDDWIHLELVLKVSITSNQDGVVEAHIVMYIFRTRPAREPPEQLALQS